MSSPPGLLPILEDYLRDPEQTFAGDKWQSDKLKKAVARFCRWAQIKPPALPQTLLALADQRSSLPLVPLHVFNIGGCGSHWLSEVVEDLGTHVDCGEVYVAPAIVQQMPGWDLVLADRFLDVLELMHAIIKPRTFSLQELAVRSTINSAHHLPNYQMLRRYRRNQKVIHLIRDPRDRSLSTALRKPGYRAYRAPDASDEEYLIGQVRRSCSHFIGYSKLAQKADLEMTYEALRTDPAGQIRAAGLLLGQSISVERAEAIARKFSAETLMGGEDAAGGNFSGDLHNWRSHKNPRHLALLHAYAAEAIFGTGYDLCDCAGRLEIPSSDYVSLHTTIPDALADAVSVAGFGGLATWHKSETNSLSGAGRIRLRLDGDFVPRADHAEFYGAVTDLCAAGSTKAALEAFLKQLTLHAALRAVDISRVPKGGETIRPWLTRFSNVHAIRAQLPEDVREQLHKDGRDADLL